MNAKMNPWGTMENMNDNQSTNAYIIVGLGPGGLDSWNPLMKGIVTKRCSPRIPNHRAPNQQLTIS